MNKCEIMTPGFPPRTRNWWCKLQCKVSPLFIMNPNPRNVFHAVLQTETLKHTRTLASTLTSHVLTHLGGGGGDVAAKSSLLRKDSIRFTPAKWKWICSFWIIGLLCSLWFLNECSLLCSRTFGNNPRVFWVFLTSLVLILQNVSSACWMLISQT